MVEEFPYGMWRSTVSARSAGATTRLGPVTVGADDAIWWAESRPEEDGAVHVVRALPEGPPVDVLARWGGEAGPDVDAWLPAGDGLVVAYRDGRVRLLRPGEEPRPLVPEPAGVHADRFTSLVPGPGGRTVWGVRVSRHDGVTVRSLVVVPLDGGRNVRTLLRTGRFVATPRPSPDGSLVAWITWDPGLMPWDGAELRIGRVTGDGLAEERLLAGGPVESVCGPIWASVDSLHVMSDRSGWWNPYQVDLDGAVRALCPWAEEFAWPPGEQDRPTYGPLGDGRLAVLHGGVDRRLDLLDPGDGTLTPLDLPYDAWQPGLGVRGRLVAGVAGARDRPPSVVTVDTADGRHRVVRRPVPALPAEYVSDGAVTTFTGRDGHEVHAIVYPPRNPRHRALPGERVPYVLFLADGPATQVTRVLDPVTTFFTSRGLGVAEIRPRGSAGYGRTYREQVFGRWGVADVEDCAVAVRGLREHWNADPGRLAIRGRGAGGTTALGVLAGTDLCAAATVQAPIIDLDAPETTAAGYLRRLAADSVLLRTPSWTERVRRPVLVLHGLDDTVVPPAQSARLTEVLRTHHVPHACLTFAGEGHTFRRAGTVERALEAELSFYGQVLGFEPPDIPRLRVHDPASGLPSGLGWPVAADRRAASTVGR